MFLGDMLHAIVGFNLTNDNYKDALTLLQNSGVITELLHQSKFSKDKTLCYCKITTTIIISIKGYKK